MTHLKFVAEPNPAPSRCEQLESLDPTNPFTTFACLEAKRTTGEPWLLCCLGGESMAFGCIGFLRSGRFNRTLTIPSLPVAREPFWSGLKDFCSRHHVTILELNTYSSRGIQIPSLGEEISRTRRYEFVLPLDDPRADPLSKMRINHRQSVHKAIKAGLQMRLTTDTRHLEDHVRLIGSSSQRRERRGETLSHEASAASLQPYLTSCCCLLFQAVLEQEVVSSMTVACSRLGGYLHTAGTSQVGMGVGASHFLLYEILKATISRGATVFNLGGVKDQDSGLAKYKKHFGAHCIPLEAATFYVGSALHKLLSTPAGVARSFLGNVSRKFKH